MITAAVDASETPQLDLQFVASPSQTRLQYRRVSYPYAVTTALDVGDSPVRMATVIIQSVSGGIFEGEKLRHQIRLREGARACVTTQGATVVHSMRGNWYADVQVAIGLDGMSYFEYRPHPLVLFPDSRLRQRVNVRLSQGAAVVLSDGFVSHDPTGGERSFAWLDSAVEVHCESGRLIAADRISVDGSTAIDGPPGISGGVYAHGWVLAVAPSAMTGLAKTFAELSRAFGSNPDLYSGASALRDDLGFFVRIAAKDGGAMRSGLERALLLARQTILGAVLGKELPGGTYF